MQRCVVVVSSLALAVACAAQPRVEFSPAEVSLPAASGSSVAAAPAEPADDGAPVVLTRALVRQAVQDGIGRFLAEVDLSPVIRGGRFVGFRLERARGLARWNAAGLAVRRGDVVTRVNGSPIERPEQAQAVFAQLADADAIVLDVMRGEGAMTLRVAITPDPSAVTDASTAR
jgi:type II secretory pathway component PulC